MPTTTMTPNLPRHIRQPPASMWEDTGRRMGGYGFRGRHLTSADSRLAAPARDGSWSVSLRWVVRKITFRATRIVSRESAAPSGFRELLAQPVKHLCLGGRIGHRVLPVDDDWRNAHTKVN